MVIIGKYAIILVYIGNKLDGSPFKPDYQSMEKVSIVDLSVQYTCQYMAKVYVFMFRNSLSVPIMDNNLIPPLIMRETGMVVKVIAKIHINNPSVDNYSIYFHNFRTLIMLFLRGVFSSLLASKPSLTALERINDIYLMAP